MDIVAKLLENNPCGTTLGHGESCQLGRECQSCTDRLEASKEIYALRQQLAEQTSAEPVAYDKLRSALSLMLTYFGMDEDYSNKEVFETARKALLAEESAIEKSLILPRDLHPETKLLCARFVSALAEKLHKAEQKYGYSDGWRFGDWMDECRVKLNEHIEKGDPLDVAAYCAFLWHHGSFTTPPSVDVLVEALRKVHNDWTAKYSWQFTPEQHDLNSKVYQAMVATYSKPITAEDNHA